MNIPTLFHMPGACSRVTMNALEEARVEYFDRPIDILTGEQKSPQYLAINPKGKVPALLLDGRVLTENVAILRYLHEQSPQAGILPFSASAFDRALSVSDLVWCSGTLHPIVRAVFRPAALTEGDGEPVKSHAIGAFRPVAELLQQRFANAPWWYGDHWSIVDVYLSWLYGIAAAGGFDLSTYPALGGHGERVRARPSFQRALAREQRALEKANIKLPPGASL